MIITVTAPDGTTEQHCVWLAATAAEQEQGLQGVTDPTLGGLAGMAFSFPSDTDVPFWMKNTPLPLSLAWFDADGGFVASTDMQPCPVGTRRCPTYSAGGTYRTAIEVPLGRDRELGFVNGSRVLVGGACPGA